MFLNKSLKNKKSKDSCKGIKYDFILILVVSRFVFFDTIGRLVFFFFLF